MSLLSAQDSHLPNSWSKNECSNIKLLRSVHWLAMCHAKSLKGFWEFQHSAEIKPVSPDWFLQVLLASTNDHEFVSIYQNILLRFTDYIDQIRTWTDFCLQDFDWIAQVESQGQTRYTRVLDLKPVTLLHLTSIGVKLFSLHTFFPQCSMTWIRLLVSNTANDWLVSEADYSKNLEIENQSLNILCMQFSTWPSKHLVSFATNMAANFGYDHFRIIIETTSNFQAFASACSNLKWLCCSIGIWTDTHFTDRSKF